MNAFLDHVGTTVRRAGGLGLASLGLAVAAQAQELQPIDVIRAPHAEHRSLHDRHGAAARRGRPHRQLPDLRHLRPVAAPRPHRRRRRDLRVVRGTVPRPQRPGRRPRRLRRRRRRRRRRWARLRGRQHLGGRSLRLGRLPAGHGHRHLEWCGGAVGRRVQPEPVVRHPRVDAQRHQLLRRHRLLPHARPLGPWFGRGRDDLGRPGAPRRGHGDGGWAHHGAQLPPHLGVAGPHLPAGGTVLGPPHAGPHPAGLVADVVGQPHRHLHEHADHAGPQLQRHRRRLRAVGGSRGARVRHGHAAAQPRLLLRLHPLRLRV